jgi:hypothetical protein
MLDSSQALIETVERSPLARDVTRHGADNGQDRRYRDFQCGEPRSDVQLSLFEPPDP